MGDLSELQQQHEQLRQQREALERQRLEQEIAAEQEQINRLRANGVPTPPSNLTDSALSGEEQQIRRWQTQLRSNHLRRQIDPIEAEQAFEVFFSRAWNSHMDARRRLAGVFGGGEQRP